MEIKEKEERVFEFDARFWLNLILLSIILGFSIVSFIYFSGTCSLVKENPYVYAAKQAKASECSCLINDKILYFNQERAWHIVRYESDNKIDYSNLTNDLEKLKGGH